MSKHIIAIDQGTTSSRSIVFDEQLKIVASYSQEFQQFYPDSGWVEHDPEAIWQTTLATFKKATRDYQAPKALGITNQRETMVLWDKKSGQPVMNAIVWQDRRTADYCKTLIDQGLSEKVNEKTGLLIDPYFSATKIKWLLDNVAGLKSKAEAGQICFGTIDTFLIWRLTGGKVHVTDATNASRTLLYNIHTGNWDEELLQLFDIPAAILPAVHDSSAIYGYSDPSVLGVKIPIAGIAGDQQAALVGQGCFSAGAVKSTYGTGCFALINIGQEVVLSKNKLLTTVGYQLKGQRTYALEGSIYIAGAVVSWLRDGLKIIKSSDESDLLARQAGKNSKTVFVPAFVGLGAPYWNNQCRGAIYNLTRATTAADIAKAALEAVAFQTYDLLRAMHSDLPTIKGSILRVDGGMTNSDWLMQQLADILDIQVDRPVIKETTALGAAYLAGLALDIYPEPLEFAKSWQREKSFLPDLDITEREKKLKLWHDAVARTILKT